MPTLTSVSLEEYLSTTYRPDCDYIDGELEERNVGQRDHSRLQTRIGAWFEARRKQLGLEAFVELRMRVSHARYRIPDVCVVTLPQAEEQVLTHAPYIAIEVMSPDDSFPRLQQRFDDYLGMGIENIWVIDSNSGRAWHVTKAGHLEAHDRILRTTDGIVTLTIDELLA